MVRCRCQSDVPFYSPHRRVSKFCKNFANERPHYKYSGQKPSNETGYWILDTFPHPVLENNSEKEFIYLLLPRRFAFCRPHWLLCSPMCPCPLRCMKKMTERHKKKVITIASHFFFKIGKGPLLADLRLNMFC